MINLLSIGLHELPTCERWYIGNAVWRRDSRAARRDAHKMFKTYYGYWIPNMVENVFGSIESIASNVMPHFCTSYVVCFSSVKP